MNNSKKPFETYLQSSLVSLTNTFKEKDFSEKFRWIADTGSFERWLQLELGWQLSKRQYIDQTGTFWTFPERKNLIDDDPNHPVDLPIFLNGGKNKEAIVLIELKVFYNTRLSIKTINTKAFRSLISDINRLKKSKIPTYICVAFVLQKYLDPTLNKELLDFNKVQQVEDCVKEKLVESFRKRQFSATVEWLQNPTHLFEHKDELGDGFWEALSLSMQFARIS